MAILMFQACHLEKNETGKSALLQVIKSEAGHSKGEVHGLRVDQQYYSSLFLIQNKDTLLTFGDDGIKGKEIDFPVDPKAYDGYEIEFENPQSFLVWLSKREGGASDGAFVSWDESLKAFTFSLAGPPIIIR